MNLKRKLERALLVTVDLKKGNHFWSAEERSRELRDLARSAGARVVHEEIVRRNTLQPALFIGKGKAEELSHWCVREKIGIVIFNNDLTASQQKNLEEIIGTKTIDRTQLILDIFARRARSNEGKIQVELAQLLYLLPRLTGKGIMLSRLGGGIGTRGPGEQKLEVDRRRIRQRIGKLKKNLMGLSARRAMMRAHRKRFAALTVAIVGYTNAGKSTLLNALTQSSIIAEDRLFSTLDPTVRQFLLPNKQKILFVDTVGFLKDLPLHLIEAFKATLEEVAAADIILHLIDASHPKADEQRNETYKILKEIGAAEVPVIPVVNKMDTIQNAHVRNRIKERFSGAETISALQKTGLTGLIDRIAAYLDKMMSAAAFEIPSGAMKLLNLIYEQGVVTKKEYRDSFIYIEAVIPVRLKETIEKKLSGPNLS